MRTIKKSTLFTEQPLDNGNCEFRLWDAKRRDLWPCGERAHAFTGGRKKYYLCPEHGAFVQDAHDVRDVYYQAELLKEAK